MVKLVDLIIEIKYTLASSQTHVLASRNGETNLSL